jgi:hypothetical protein
MLGHGLFDEAGITHLIEAQAAGADNTQAIWLLLAFEGFLHMLGGHTAPRDEPGADWLGGVKPASGRRDGSGAGGCAPELAA